MKKESKQQMVMSAINKLISGAKSDVQYYQEKLDEATKLLEGLTELKNAANQE